MLWDFTCSDTYAPSHLDVSSKKSCRAGKAGKIDKVCTLQLEHDFEMGLWGPNCLKFVQEVGRRI